MTISPAYARICAKYFSGERPAFATTLVAILLRCYGAEVLNWDSAALSAQILDDFKVELDRKTHDKIQALITVLTTDQVYQYAEVFGHVVDCLSGHGIRTNHGPPNPEDVAWMVAECELCDPQPEGRDPNNRWSRAVKGYIRVVLDDSGLTIKPKSLAMAAERPGSLSSTTDAAQFAGAWESHQKGADEIDEIVARRMDLLMGQLRAVGVPVQVKTSSVEQTLPDGTVVKEVDGEKIRNTQDAGFIGGGHGEVYSYIPKKEIWIEGKNSKDDKSKILLHEMVELALMRQGDGYDKSHETANKLESKARGAPVEGAKVAEWTSEANKLKHVAKHSGEFGSPEEYLKAEEEHSTNPPDDQIQTDHRCKTGPDGKPRCAVSMMSPSKGTLHVKTLEDGRTVTLYKPGK